MLDVNMIIANNIQAELKKENKKQVDLAEGIGVSKQTMSKLMNGARAINDKTHLNGSQFRQV